MDEQFVHEDQMRNARTQGVGSMVSEQNRQNALELMRKMHSCTEPYREILYLRIFGNLSFREIGEIMGKSENWARVNYYRAKERLKKEVEENE